MRSLTSRCCARAGSTQAANARATPAQRICCGLNGTVSSHPDGRRPGPSHSAARRPDDRSQLSSAAVTRLLALVAGLSFTLTEAVVNESPIRFEDHIPGPEGLVDAGELVLVAGVTARADAVVTQL